MGEFISAYNSEKSIKSSREILRARRKFTKIVRRLPSEQRSFLSDLSSVFSEPDIYNEFVKDPKNSQNFNSELMSMGFGKRDIKTIMIYFNLPYEEKL